MCLNKGIMNEAVAVAGFGCVIKLVFVLIKDGKASTRGKNVCGGGGVGEFQSLSSLVIASHR